MVSDLEIARGANPLPIEEVAWSLGIGVEDLVLYGEGMAKIKYRAFEARKNRAEGFLVLVTGVNPTPYGEGKTVTAIGLTQ